MRHASFVRGHSNELDIAASITTVFMLIFFQTNCYLNNLTGLHVFDDFRNFQSLILIVILWIFQNACACNEILPSCAFNFSFLHKHFFFIIQMLKKLHRDVKCTYFKTE